MSLIVNLYFFWGKFQMKYFFKIIFNIFGSIKNLTIVYMIKKSINLNLIDKKKRLIKNQDYIQKRIKVHLKN